MLDRTLARAAFRTRAGALVVATTGSATLSATATGYHRSSGSFITDKFVVGMEVGPTGFTQTTPGVITAVAASDLTILGGRTVQASGSGRTLTSGLPATHPLTNVVVAPAPNRPYIEDDFVMGGGRIRTMPTRLGLHEETGLSVWRWYGVAGFGDVAISVGVTALLRLFTPGTSLTLSDGTVIEVRGDQSPSDSQIIPTGDGWAVCTVTIPWIVRTRNVIAA